MKAAIPMTVLTSVSRLIAGLLLLAGCFALAAPVAPVKAAGLEGTKTIYLVDNAGEEREIGTATFSKADGAVSITIALDQGRFSEKFLSMRPFRCIDGPKQTACHLPYPYELKDRITPEDLSDLEYRLLFLHKGPTDYGIDAWNGLYYKFELAADGTLKGKLHEADFNVLAVPPAQAFSKPIGPADLVPGEEGRHRFPSLTIR